MSKRVMARTIWKEVFGDDERFLDLYFARVYRQNETLLFVDNFRGVALSHLGMPSYLIDFWGNLVRAYYISGAATLPEARGKGFMQSLMRAAHMQMYRSGALFSFLIPAEESLYDYYEKVADYVPAAKAQTLFCRREDFDGEPQLPEDNQGGVLYDAYLQEVQLRKSFSPRFYVHHTFESWHTALLCAQLYGGGAVAVKGSPSLFFERAVASKSTMLAVLPNDRVSRKNNSVGPVYRHGMIRLINMRLLLQLYALQHPELLWQFTLYDRDLLPNCGCYRIEKGRLLFVPFRGAALQKLIQECGERPAVLVPRDGHSNFCTPASLARFLFPDDVFHFDLLLDPIKE